MKRFLTVLFLLVSFILIPKLVFARTEQEITDWYIKDFQSEIVVNDSSTLLITEKIIADCGNLSDKHGIFRTLPTQYKNDQGTTIKTPIELESITDQSGQSYEYSVQKNIFDHTITWKIGSANKTVTGENTYMIKYKVKNAIDFTNNYDRFNLNLSGNYWQIEIDNFKATITFPAEITKKNTKDIKYYFGTQGSRDNTGAQFYQPAENIFVFQSNKTMINGEGLTADIKFEKGIFAQYKPTFFEAYGFCFFFLIPFLVFILAFNLWRKHGQDPKKNGPIMAEYDVPNNLTPLEVSYLQSGAIKNQAISAEIIKLAVDGIIKIEEVPKTNIFSGKDYKLTLLKKEASSDAQKYILVALFRPIEKANIMGIKINKGYSDQTSLTEAETNFNELKVGAQVNLSSLKNYFYVFLTGISESVRIKMINESYVESENKKQLWFLIIMGTIALFVGFSQFSSNASFAISLVISGIILYTFGFLMGKVTEKGAETIWKIKGFKLFMDTAEKYRQQFNEKENIFEKFLPYAILFGITKEWMKKIEQIYGSSYFSTYHPIWFVGTMSAFDINSLNSAINSVSNSISQASSSGSGGAGGGAGGGGGGGW